MKRGTYADLSVDVRSILMCDKTARFMIVLHPRSTNIHYRANGEIGLLTNQPPLKRDAGLFISNATIERCMGSRVIIQGAMADAIAPTPIDLLEAPYLDQRPRKPGSSPRAVRPYIDGPQSTQWCDWTPEEWTDYENELISGQVMMTQTGTLGTPPSGSVFTRDGSRCSPLL